MNILRYIAELDEHSQVEGLCRILQTPDQLWGEYYAGNGKWIEDNYVTASYIREPGANEFFHDEERAKEIMNLLDEK